METFKIYTSGATKNVSIDESYCWRDTAKEYLEKCDSFCHVKVFVPEQYFNYHTLHPKTEKQCMSYFLHNVELSDLMLVNLNHSVTSIGTGMEVQKANDLGVHIIGFGKNDVYPWISECCDIVFDDMKEALEYIKDYYL